MPAITSGKVLITGINGFSAMWLAKGALESGFYVRGTVRTKEKGVHPKEYFKPYGDKVEIVMVPDITQVRTRTSDIVVLKADLSSILFPSFSQGHLTTRLRTLTLSFTQLPLFMFKL